MSDAGGQSLKVVTTCLMLEDTARGCHQLCGSHESDGWDSFIDIGWPGKICLLEMSLNSVSISTTTALIYGLSGGTFFLLVFLLVMMGMTNCDWDCSR